MCDLKRVDGPAFFAQQGCEGEACSGKMPDEPTIFTGLINDWPALKVDWNPEELRRRYGGTKRMHELVRVHIRTRVHRCSHTLIPHLHGTGTHSYTQARELK